jgi:hypothetical protein
MFTLDGGSLTGSGPNPGVAAGQVVTIPSNNTQASFPSSLTNAGTMNVGEGGAGYSLVYGAGVLTNSGHLNIVLGGGGVRYLQLNLTNTATGTLDVAGQTLLQDGGYGATTTNNGTVTVEATGSLALGGGASFISAGGTLTNNGAVGVNGGTFTQRGGIESGNAVVVSNGTLDDDLGAAAGMFTLDGGSLTGSGPNPGVAAGQVVTIPSNNTQASVAVNLTNAGTIILGDSGSGYSLLNGPGDLTDTGLLQTVIGGGGPRYLYLNVINAAGGTVDIATATSQPIGNTTTNNGTFTVEAAGTFALSGGSSFTQGASGTLAVTIDANTATFGQLTGGGGSVSLDGELKVTGIGPPAIASSWPIISGANRTGQFATLEFTINTYDVQYSPTGVTLVVLS